MAGKAVRLIFSANADCFSAIGIALHIGKTAAVRKNQQNTAEKVKNVFAKYDNIYLNGGEAMDWIKSFQKSIDYIEENLLQPLDMSEIAAKMNISPFYYQKIFSVICGFSASEYIRNRRLALAGSELVSSDEKALDIALKYGYDTHEGFTRAFTRFHGVTPSAAKKGAPIKSFARLTVTISMKGGTEMDYQIVKKDKFKVAEKRGTHTVSENANNRTIPEFWEKCHADGTVKRLSELSCDKSRIFGICYSNPHTSESTFEYSVAAAIDDGCEIPDEFTANEIPSQTWAVFKCEGELPEAIQNLWHRICTEFLPSSDYEMTCEMDIEAYATDNYNYEIWVPVVKK